MKRAIIGVACLCAICYVIYFTVGLLLSLLQMM